MVRAGRCVSPFSLEFLLSESMTLVLYPCFFYEYTPYNIQMNRTSLHSRCTKVIIYFQSSAANLSPTLKVRTFMRKIVIILLSLLAIIALIYLFEILTLNSRIGKTQTSELREVKQ